MLKGHLESCAIPVMDTGEYDGLTKMEVLTTNTKKQKLMQNKDEDNVLAAIEEFKNGEKSFLQASKMYKVPSRTLYGRLKKMGILTTNMKKQKSLNYKLYRNKDKDYMLAAIEKVKNGEKSTHGFWIDIFFNI